MRACSLRNTCCTYTASLSGVSTNLESPVVTSHKWRHIIAEPLWRRHLGCHQPEAVMGCREALPCIMLGVLPAFVAATAAEYCCIRARVVFQPSEGEGAELSSPCGCVTYLALQAILFAHPAAENGIMSLNARSV